MIVSSAKFIFIKTPLSKPIKTHRISLYDREYYVVILQDEKGNSVATGDIAPLPYFSVESLQCAFKQCVSFLESHFPFELKDILNLERRERLYPSVTWCFYQLLLNFNLSINQNVLRPFIKTSFLLDTYSKEAFNQARSKGFDCFKLKFNDSSLYSFLQEIEDEDVKIRIDVNGFWDKEASITPLLAFLNKLEKFSRFIEYIEDISLDRQRIIRVKSQTTIPLAVDETLRTINDLNFFIENGIIFLIIKPTLLNDISICYEAIVNSRGKKIYPIFSHAFEPKNGQTALSYLANMAEHSRHHGICFDYM